MYHRFVIENNNKNKQQKFMLYDFARLFILSLLLIII